MGHVVLTMSMSRVVKRQLQRCAQLCTSCVACRVEATITCLPEYLNPISIGPRINSLLMSLLPAASKHVSLGSMQRCLLSYLRSIWECLRCTVAARDSSFIFTSSSLQMQQSCHIYAGLYCISINWVLWCSDSGTV